MLAKDRKKEILKILEKQGSIKTNELVKVFEVSLETIRRDFEALEKEGYVEKVYGGAVLKNNVLNYSSREKKNISEKKEIAEIALNHIENGDTIALNASTTNLEIAKKIKEKKLKLTVLTNSLIIANELAEVKEVNLILAGGIYNQEEYAFLGEVTAKFFQNFSVDKAFVGVGGISLKKGITDYLIDEIIVERKIIEIAEKIYILADSTKIENNSLIKVAELSKEMKIVTDSKIDKKIIEKYSKNGIEILK